MVAVLELCASLQENLGALETAALHSPTKRCQSIPVTSLQIFGGICSYQEVVEQGDMTALSGNMQWATLTQICDVRACSSKQFKALCLPFLHGLEHNFVILSQQADQVVVRKGVSAAAAKLTKDRTGGAEHGEQGSSKQAGG
eukprot:m.596657 g.596657  ORF g.596657 m.596657 type:complete len:142 (-) comp58053_c0_seq7:446-871(-)